MGLVARVTLMPTPTKMSAFFYDMRADRRHDVVMREPNSIDCAAPAQSQNKTEQT